MVVVVGVGVRVGVGVGLSFFKSDREKFDFDLINKKDPGEKFNWA